MKRVIKGFMALLLIMGMLLGSTVTKIDVKADSPYGLGDTIQDTFSDANLAQAIADALPSAGGNINHVLTAADAATTSLALDSKEITDLTGIGFFNQLLELSVSDNSITNLPAELFASGTLQYLYADYNDITSIDEGIGSASSLHTVWLTSNKLSSLPAAMASLSSLSFLDLGYNQFSEFPVSILGLTGLKDLKMHYNQMTSIPEEIGNLTSLQTFWVTKNNLTSLPDVIPTMGLKNVTGILTQGNQFHSISQELHDFLSVKGSAQTHQQIINETLAVQAGLNQDFTFDGYDLYTQLPLYGTTLEYVLVTPSASITLTPADITISGGQVTIAGSLLNEEGAYSLEVSGTSGVYNGTKITQAFEAYALADAQLTGLKDISMTVGESLDLLAGISALDYDSSDISSSIVISITDGAGLDAGSDVSKLKAGTYTVKYSITGASGNEVSGTVKLTVKEKTVDPADPDKAQPGTQDSAGKGQSQSSKAVKTGDETRALTSLLLMLFSAVAVIYFVKKKRIVK